MTDSVHNTTPHRLETRHDGEVWFVPHGYRVEFSKRPDPEPIWRGMLTAGVSPATARAIMASIHPGWEPADAR